MLYLLNTKGRGWVNKSFINICKFIIAVFLPVVILFTVLELYSYNLNFYMSSYKKNNVSQITGMDEKDLKRVTIKIMDYLKNKEDNLEIEVHIRGELREAFGEREKLHMVDVKKLFLNGYIIRNTGIILLVLSTIIILIKSQKPIKDMLTSLLYSGILSFLIVIVIYILTKIDFDKYFTYFHEIFFNNDLWLLDPDELLIQLVPLEFFIDITTRIIGWFLGIEFLISSISFYLLKRNKIRVNL